MNDHLIVDKGVIGQSIEVVVGNVNVTIRLVILSKEGEPTLDHLLAHPKILAKLLHVRIPMIVSRTNNDNIKVLWDKRKTIVHLGSVVEKVDNMTTVPELRTTDLADVHKAMHTGNEHLLNLT
jgi:hypothetical protein